MLTEAEEAKVLVAYMRIKGYMFTHVPSETGSSMEARRRAIRMKQQGTTRGFPDYIVLAHGKLLFIELKRVRGGRTSPEQLEWIDAINACGGVAAVCKGAQAAIEFIEGSKED